MNPHTETKITTMFCSELTLDFCLGVKMDGFVHFGLLPPSPPAIIRENLKHHIVLL